MGQGGHRPLTLSIHPAHANTSRYAPHISSADYEKANLRTILIYTGPAAERQLPAVNENATERDSDML